MWVDAVCADRLTILRDERDVVLASRIDEYKYDLFKCLNDRDVVTMRMEFGGSYGLFVQRSKSGEDEC